MSDDTIDARIVSIAKDTLIDDGSRFLDVSFEILDGDTVLAIRKLGFPYDTPAEDIEEAVKNTARGFKADLALAETRQVQDAEDEAADDTIKSLTEKEL